MGDFNQIYEDYLNKIYKLCLYKTENKEEAEDLTQEIFIKIFKSIKSFKGNSSLYTWIYTIAVRTCVDHKNKKYKNKEIFELDYSLCVDSTIEEDHIQKDRNSTISKCIHKLEDKYRIVLYLYYYEDMKIKDIGIVLGKTENTIKTWISRGKDKLKKELSKEGVNYE